MLPHMGDKVSSILVGRFCACSLNISLMILVYSFFLSSLISWRRSIAYPLLLINSRKGWIARTRRVSFAALLCTGHMRNFSRTHQQSRKSEQHWKQKAEGKSEENNLTDGNIAGKMANPRRSSYSVNINDDGAGAGVQQFSSSSSSSSTSSFFSSSPLLISLKHWLKRPHAVPFLLSAFLLLTWLSLLLQQRSSHSSSLSARIGDGRKYDDDRDANLFRFRSGSGIRKGERGWLLDPVSLAHEHGLKGGAGSCASVHVGEIRPGTLRGNHRHNACNETLVIWGAKTLFRLENHQIVDTGYAEVIVEGDEVAVATSPSGTAHALVNINSLQSTFIIGCQDCITDHSSSSKNSSHTDFKVWPDL